MTGGLEGAPALKIWGGLECTVNRVRDSYLNQLERNGHTARSDDLERFATLGIEAIRYPLLWELMAPNGLDAIDWTWPDERMGEVCAACAILKPDATLTLTDLTGWSREQMANYKLPRHLFVVEDFPRTPLGKIQKFLLRAQANASE